jgi:hypothetical protein
MILDAATVNKYGHLATTISLCSGMRIIIVTNGISEMSLQDRKTLASVVNAMQSIKPVGFNWGNDTLLVNFQAVSYYSTHSNRFFGWLTDKANYAAIKANPSQHIEI